MHAMQPFFLGLSLLLGGTQAAHARTADLSRLQEMLHDEQHPQDQSQAALLLVQNPSDEAQDIVRQGLRQLEAPEVFGALAGAVRANQDDRYAGELLAALAGGRGTVRQTAAETLAAMLDDALLQRMTALVRKEGMDLTARQLALWALGRSGRKQVVPVLLELLSEGNEVLRRASASALAELSGLDFGENVEHWQAWWKRQKHMSTERWLEQRLAYQTSRANRLDGDLGRARAQVLRLQQQLYSRLSVTERVSHIQSLLEQEDPSLRLLAVTWSLELLPTADLARRELLTQVLLRLSHDACAEVQRAAVLSLGRVPSPAAFTRLQVLLDNGRPCVRTAAARSLAMHASGTDAASRARLRVVVPALQKTLHDSALEVVVEAAEDLGMLGALEAGPVLTSLLRHRSEYVRQAAAQALERVAEPSILDGLLGAVEDPSVAVRFSLVGALGHAGGEGHTLTEAQRKRLLEALKLLLLRDADPGVRCRAAVVLGDLGSPDLLADLWGCVESSNGRVQEKAWAAFLEVLSRSGSLTLLRQWDRRLAEARQDRYRLLLLTEVVASWQKNEERKDVVGSAVEALVQAQLDLGKWSAAWPQLRELLAHSGSEAEVDRRLRKLLSLGEQALRDGDRSAAARVVQEAQPFLARTGTLRDGFASLEKKARQ
jgi:HEAT repeat protein